MTSSTTATKKRPAPGTSPPVPDSNKEIMSSQKPRDSGQPPMSNDQFFSWGSGSGALPFSDSLNPYGTISLPDDDRIPSRQHPHSAPSTQPNNQLIKRVQDQQLAQRGHQNWRDDAQSQGQVWEHPEDDRDLERKAASAKRDAMSKKKQIPPFIQKLSSFLDNNNTTDLIRWSDSGDSFVVLDEEQFASKLIPELFKHNNYASFVRQLNMYGFHKKVGLSDNSMRASEKKSRMPSEYENPYFKRGRPELLWLIAKPRPQTSAGKRKGKKSGDMDQESEEEELRDYDDGGYDMSNKSNRNLDLVTLPRTQLQSYQREIDVLKKSQQQINSMIARFQHENNQYIRQASAQHERHENSINAILTFLATFYSRSVEGSGTQLFPGSIPNTQPQGNVVEEEYDEPSANTGQLQRAPRSRLALLPAPDVSSDQRQQSQSLSPDGSSRPSSSTPMQHQSQPRLQVPQNQTMRPSNLRNTVPQSNPTSNRTTPTPTTQDNSTSPSPQMRSSNSFESPSSSTTNTIQHRYSTQDPLSSSSYERPKINTNTNANAEDIMAVIKNVNAATPPSATANFDNFSNALRSYENSDGNAPLTSEQRDNVLSLMANTSGGGSDSGNATNALLRTEKAQDQSSLGHYNSNRQAIDTLARLQSEQGSKLADLSGRLQPLSPNGNIPGLDMNHLEGNGSLFNPDVNLSPVLPNASLSNSDGAFNANSNAATTGNGGGGTGADLDMNTFLNSDYFQDFPASSTANDLNNAGVGGLDFGDNPFGNGFDGAEFGTEGFGGGVGDGDGNIFGGDNVADVKYADGNAEGSARFDNAFDDGNDATGRIVGSVGSSSGGASPAFTDGGVVGGGGGGGGGDDDGGGGGAEDGQGRNKRLRSG